MAVWLLPDPVHDAALLASVEVMTGRIKGPTGQEQELYEAIWRRRTNRSPYRLLPAPLPILVAMEHAAAKEGAWLRLLHPRMSRKWMRLADADSDPAFRAPFPNRVPAANYGPPPKNRLTERFRQRQRAASGAVCVGSNPTGGAFSNKTSERSIPARLPDLHLYNPANNITARETPGRLVPARRGHRAVRRAQRRSTMHKCAKG